MKKKVDKVKFALLQKIADSMPENMREFILNDCEIVGLCDRVSYHKVWAKEDIPYTHIFENETILLKHKKSPMVIIYGPKIAYRRGYIEN